SSARARDARQRQPADDDLMALWHCQPLAAGHISMQFGRDFDEERDPGNDEKEWGCCTPRAGRCTMAGAAAGRERRCPSPLATIHSLGNRSVLAAGPKSVEIRWRLDMRGDMGHGAGVRLCTRADNEGCGPGKMNGEGRCAARSSARAREHRQRRQAADNEEMVLGQRSLLAAGQNSVNFGRVYGRLIDSRERRDDGLGAPRGRAGNAAEGAPEAFKQVPEPAEHRFHRVRCLGMLILGLGDHDGDHADRVHGRRLRRVPCALYPCRTRLSSETNVLDEVEGNTGDGSEEWRGDVGY
ncbi:hypothetical protein EVG20_g11001, partial [Dentipellis fragilis]